MPTNLLTDMNATELYYTFFKYSPMNMLFGAAISLFGGVALEVFVGEWVYNYTAFVAFLVVFTLYAISDFYKNYHKLDKSSVDNSKWGWKISLQFLAFVAGLTAIHHISQSAPDDIRPAMDILKYAFFLFIVGTQCYIRMAYNVKLIIGFSIAPQFLVNFFNSIDNGGPTAITDLKGNKPITPNNQASEVSPN